MCYLLAAAAVVVLVAQVAAKTACTDLVGGVAASARTCMEPTGVSPVGVGAKYGNVLDLGEYYCVCRA